MTDPISQTTVVGGASVGCVIGHPLRMFDQYGEISREQWVLENILVELKAIHALLKEQRCLHDEIERLRASVCLAWSVQNV